MFEIVGVAGYSAHDSFSAKDTVWPSRFMTAGRQVHSKFEVEKHLQGQTVLCKRQNDAPDLLTPSPVRRVMSRGFA